MRSLGVDIKTTFCSPSLLPFYTNIRHHPTLLITHPYTYTVEVNPLAYLLAHIPDSDILTEPFIPTTCLPFHTEAVVAAEIAEGAETPTNVVAEIAEGVEITINVVAEIAEGAEITIKVAVEDVEDRNKCHTVKDRRAMRQATYEVAVRLLYHVASI